MPYALPEHNTRSTFKTASSPASADNLGKGNELRFEDKAGSEEIYLHASKDYQEHISHNSHSHIVNDREQLIEGQHINEVRSELHHTVHGTSHGQAKADEHHVIDCSRHSLIASKELLSAGQEIHLSTGQKIVLAAGAELTFKAGGSYLKLDPSGITLVGPTIDLNNGGSPSKGTGAAALIPQVLAVTNMDRAGKVPMCMQAKNAFINPMLVSPKISTNASLNLLTKGQSTDSEAAELSFRFITESGKVLKRVVYQISTDTSENLTNDACGATADDGCTGIVSSTPNGRVSVQVLWPKINVRKSNQG